MSPPDRGKRSADRDAILARRALLVASAVGGALAPQPAQAQGAPQPETRHPAPTAPAPTASSPAPTTTAPAPTAPAPAASAPRAPGPAAPAPGASPVASPVAPPPAGPDPSWRPAICLSAPPPPPPQTHTGGSLGTEFWLPIVSSRVDRPPALMGGNMRIFLDIPAASSLELRMSAGSSLLASLRGMALAPFVQFEPTFSPIQGMISSVAVAAGAQIPLTYKAKAGEPGLLLSPLVSFSCSPFGFRFGPSKGGELGIRFGANISKRDEGTEQVWNFSSVSAGAWLAYHFSEPDDRPGVASSR